MAAWNTFIIIIGWCEDFLMGISYIWLISKFDYMF